MVIPATDEVTEHEMQQAVIEFLHTCAYGEAPYNGTKGLIFNLPNKWIKLSAKDREMQRVRDEQKWVIRLRNIGSSDHIKQPGNAIHDGILVKRRGGGFQLASKVKKY